MPGATLRIFRALYWTDWNDHRTSNNHILVFTILWSWRLANERIGNIGHYSFSSVARNVKKLGSWGFLYISCILDVSSSPLFHTPMPMGEGSQTFWWKLVTLSIKWSHKLIRYSRNYSWDSFLLNLWAPIQFGLDRWSSFAAHNSYSGLFIWHVYLPLCLQFYG